ncbi:unnamed protein product [Rangifer tarandus platyrhynchus]|uniref:Uncharacterized protein n=1 Tax=Rangifer tarandus platyrhynchus TaxID=3082113 RepID=A0AC59YCV0_RANTA
MRSAGGGPSVAEGCSARRGHRREPRGLHTQEAGARVPHFLSLPEGRRKQATMWERDLETPASLGGLCYLMSSFLTDTKHPLKTSTGRSPRPSDVWAGSFLSSFPLINSATPKFLTHQAWPLVPKLQRLRRRSRLRHGSP